MQMQQAQELQQRQIQQSLEELRQSTQTHQQNSVQMHQQGHEVMAAQQQQIQQLAAQQASGPIAPLPEKFPEQGPGTQMLPPPGSPMPEPRPPDQPAVVLKRRICREELLAEGNLCELGLPDEGGAGRQTTVRVTGFDHNRDGVPDALQGV
ncbi:unnamed protein product, partial [Prorocentrum cordatum]